MPISYPQPSSTVIVSTTAPNNPTTGMEWLELDSSNNLIESWYRLNNAWRSSVKTWDVNLSIDSSKTSLSVYKSLASEYDYFLSHCLIMAGYMSYQPSATNYFQITMSARTNNIIPGSPPNLIINNQSPSHLIVNKLSWNYLFSTTAANKNLCLTLSRNGQMTGDVNIQYFYQAIRK